MKKIFNRVLAAAIAIPMTLTQGVVMTTSAEGTGAKSITLDTFVAIPADQTESTWNARLMTMVNSLNGTEQEINKADFLAMLPEANTYSVMLKEVLADAANPVMTVKDGVITVSGTADMTAYAQAKIYNKINEAAGTELTLDAFNKTVEYSVTVDANVLMNGKTVDVDPVVVVDGTDLKGLSDDLAAQVSAQVGVTADIEAAMTVEMIQKVERAEAWADKAESLSRTGSYASADEMMAAVSKFFDSRTDLYTFPASVDEAVARHGAGFNQAVELISGITESHGYTISITADEVAALAKEGTNFEVAVSGGTYEVTFNIPDAEAAEVEAYVNSNESGEYTDKKYVSSIKLVEASVTTDGVAYFNVTREIVTEDADQTSTTTGTDETTDSTTATTTATTEGTGDSSDTSDTATVTTVSTDDGSSTSTTETTVTTGTDDTVTGTDDTTTGSGEGSDTTTTETTTATTGSDDITSSTTDTTDTTGSDDTTTSTTTTTLAPDFELESVEISAGEGYYFSHDENAFDLGELVESLVLVGNINGEATSYVISPQDYATYLAPAYASPKAFFESVDGLAYVANTLTLNFVVPADRKTAENFDGTLAEQPTVYIGVKGDANLDAVVNIADATEVLTYYAKFGASLNPVLNADEKLNTLAFFLADVDTESKAGVSGDEGMLLINDATNILTYYAQYAASLDPSWDDIIG